MEPLVWQCARATSAAPLYFQSFYLAPLGDCWDGGLAHNNPAALCHQELRYMWPWKPPLGILLSIGTGFKQPHSPRAGPRRTAHILHRRHFFWPLFDTLMSSMDGRASWSSFVHRTCPGDRDPFSRLDVPLPGPPPALDAAD
ncbi:hypothetical protein BJY01DRAFT_139686 [Aspergillus pseudoustus]|uniref:PNPLA domain-containing protein n=1 Tax=Aspergillus pseudoustus TaxID=1810923 RepID=A0ABR4IHM9_9EURO